MHLSIYVFSVCMNAFEYLCIQCVCECLCIQCVCECLCIQCVYECLCIQCVYECVCEFILCGAVSTLVTRVSRELSWQIYQVMHWGTSLCLSLSLSVSLPPLSFSLSLSLSTRCPTVIRNQRDKPLIHQPRI